MDWVMRAFGSRIDTTREMRVGENILKPLASKNDVDDLEGAAKMEHRMWLQSSFRRVTSHKQGCYSPYSVHADRLRPSHRIQTRWSMRFVSARSECTLRTFDCMRREVLSA